MLTKLFYLKEGELYRSLPFFALYLLLTSALTLADGLSLALFVQRAGPSQLPGFYALIAIINVLLLAWYSRSALQVGNARVFQLILAACIGIYLAAWVAVKWFQGGDGWFGVLFVSREIAFTMIVMHFGNYVQDYFTREEMNRVLPIVYSGGRIGGILGGSMLEHLSGVLGLMNLVLLFAVLVLICMGTLLAITLRLREVHVPEDHRSDSDVTNHSDDHQLALEKQAQTSMGGFLRFVFASPLLFWITVTTILFMTCRWILNFQYNSFFAASFTDDVAMAAFLGRYTQIALVISLVIQVFFVGRMVAWLGVKWVYLIYAGLLFSSMTLNLLPMTMATAIFARLMETELRFGLRNPVMQMITNKFSKGLRVRVRAWSQGMLIPVGTLLSSGVLAYLVRGSLNNYVSWVGFAIGVLFMLGSFGVYRALSVGTILASRTAGREKEQSIEGRSAEAEKAKEEVKPAYNAA